MTLSRAVTRLRSGCHSVHVPWRCCIRIRELWCAIFSEMKMEQSISELSVVNPLNMAKVDRLVNHGGWWVPRCNGSLPGRWNSPFPVKVHRSGLLNSEGERYMTPLLLQFAKAVELVQWRRITCPSILVSFQSYQTTWQSTLPCQQEKPHHPHWVPFNNKWCSTFCVNSQDNRKILFRTSERRKHE